MGKNVLLPIGVDDFGVLVRREDSEGNKSLFVDKTLLIKSFVDVADIISLITRPRRFGKTLGLSMLEHFFAKEVNGMPTQGLFDGLLISKHPEAMRYQGQYPVIFLTLKDVKGNTYESLYRSFVLLIRSLFEKHQYLLKSKKITAIQKEHITFFLKEKGDAKAYAESLHFLSRLLFQHTGKKVMLFLDEYDTPMHQAFIHGYYEEGRSLMSALFGKTFKGNEYIEKALITGILKISKASLFSDLNNVEVYSMLKDRQYGQYFGFTAEETNDLLDRAGLPKKAHTLKEFYDAAKLFSYFLLLRTQAQTRARSL